MGVMRQCELRDKRGQRIEANLADSVNVVRTPKVRDQILQGQFHRVRLPTDGRRVSVEKTFFYTDFDRSQFFLVLPRWDRYRWEAAGKELESMMARVPDFLASGPERTIRVVFGLAELREKLIIFDAGLDDELVELLKVLLLSHHSFLLDTPRLNLVLDKADAEEVVFLATYDHDPSRHRVVCSRPLVDEIFAREDDLREWMAQEGLLGELLAEPGNALQERSRQPAGWVNIRRWSSGNAAVAKLDRVADLIENDNGASVDIDSDDFDLMLKMLPRGAALSGAAKRDLQTLHRWAGERKRSRKREIPLKVELLQILTGKVVRGEWSVLEPETIDRLWNVLDAVPREHLQNNSYIDRIRLGVDDENSFYDPDTDDIGIIDADLPQRAKFDHGWFEEMVLHEIGHGVHEKYKTEINEFLRATFGWETFDRSDGGIRQWIEKLGGYPQAITSLERRQIHSYIRQSLGNAKEWKPPKRRPTVAAGHPWNARDFRPRIACEKTDPSEDTTRRWYDAHEGWYRFGGSCFFANYYYSELMVVGEAAIQYVKDKVLSPYALMSPMEFFAELYAAVSREGEAGRVGREKLDPEVLEFMSGLGRRVERHESSRPLPSRVS